MSIILKVCWLYPIITERKSYYIEKNGVDFTMTSDKVKVYPLPHTKGTKPAPSYDKVIV